MHVDELVLSRNEETGETGYKKVTQTFSDNHESTIRLRIRKAGSDSEEDLLSSYGHPIFVENAGWTLAGNLKAGERIATADGNAEVVSQSIESEPLEAFNFEVAEHTATSLAKPAHGCTMEGPVTRRGLFIELRARTLRVANPILVEPPMKAAPRLEENLASLITETATKPI